MSVIQIEAVESGRFEELTRILNGIPNGVEKAAKSAMPRAVSFLRTNSGKKIQERYDISAENIRANQNINVKYTYGSGIEATVTYGGRKIPLYRYGKSSPKQPTQQSNWVHALYGGSWHMVHPGVSAAGHQLKSTGATRFENAFVARMSSGHAGIFERDGGATESGGDSISEIMGSSVAQMVGNEKVADSLATEAMQKFEERLDHEVLRLLNGWGA